MSDAIVREIGKIARPKSVWIGRRGVQLALTLEQIAALTGASRETATKVLGEYADRGLLRLGRGKVTILDPTAITTEAGD